MPRFDSRTFQPTVTALLIFALLLTWAPAVVAADEKEKTPAKPAVEQGKKGTQKNDKTKKRTAAKKGDRLNQLEARLNAIANKIDTLAGDEQSGEPEKSAEERPAKEEKKSKAEKKTAAATLGTPKVSSKAAEKKTPSPKDEKAKVDDKDKPVSLKLQSEQLKNMPWRAIGPANMSGRITDLAIHPKDSSLWYFATASGGLLRSENQGLTLEHQFDHEATISVGCIALDPTRTDTIWVGTGEANPRNSVSYGNGVYKSTDSGKTWEHMGLPKSYQIGRILIDPKSPDTVYVGALGRLYGSNRERGVYKTTDGGKSWEQVLFVDDNTGVIDMIMNPEDPSTIIATLWDRQRDEFDSWPGSEPKPEGIDGYDPIRKWGPGAGLYKTTDGGDNWTKLTKGLPSGKIGRVGLDWQTGGDHAIFAIIDCEDIGKGPKPHKVFLGLVGRDSDAGVRVTQVMPESPAAKSGAKVGDILVEVDGQSIDQFEQLSAALRDKQLGQRLSVKLRRGDDDIEFTTKLPPRPGSRESMPTVWMGVSGGDKEGKIVLKTISKNGPAEKAGLKPGDIVQHVGGETIKSYSKMIESVQAMVDGDELKLEILRDEKAMDFVVTLANRPARGRPQQSRAVMGIQGEDAKDGGATLTVITPKGPSDTAGLKAGDIVTKVSGKPLADYAVLIEQIRSRKPEDELKVTVSRGNKTLDLNVVLGDRNGATGDRPYTFSYFGQQANVQDMQGSDGEKYGGVYRSDDAGETWHRVNSLNVRPMYFSVIRVDPEDAQRVYVLGVSQFQSSDGGQSFTANLGTGVHADAHDMWVDPIDGRHMVIGCDGGFYSTHDRGKNWDHVNSAAIGQFYDVAISLKEPYWVIGGLQDNGTWAGPAISRTGGAVNEQWLSIGGGDGFVCQVDPADPDLMYFESQNGSMGRRNVRTGQRASIRPAAEKDIETRFNWRTPFLLSSHNSKLFYCAGNYVYRSLDRGTDLKRISPELTLTKRGSATALAESPRNSEVLYAGTDDGALWVTRDGGKKWKNITENLHAPGPRWVATVDASRFADGRVYVSLDGHRSDDDAPYAYVSEDFGESFEPLHRGLPVGSTRCLREDLVNENLLYLGTEYAFWISVDRGRHWTQCNQVLPTVPVHELAMHPTNGEIVLATHGRSLWAADVTGLRQLDPRKFASESALLKPTPAVRWRAQPRHGATNRRFVGENPDTGARIWYTLASDAKSVALRIHDIAGKQIAEIKGVAKAGLHHVKWDLVRAAEQGGGPRQGRGRGRRRIAEAGNYRVTLVVDGKDKPSEILTIATDPGLAADALTDAELEVQNESIEDDGEEEDGQTQMHD